MLSAIRFSRASVFCRRLGFSAYLAIIITFTGCGNKASTPAPLLAVASAHTGNFSQGQQGATYTVTVSNTGTAPTSGTVTMTDTVPSGLTLVSMAGPGWTCASTTCTRADVLAPGSAYSAITVTVNVGAAATSPLINQVSVSGGGSATENGQDSTTILLPVLSINKTHTGNFAQGQLGASYTVTVKNTGAAPTNGTTVTVSETAPVGLTIVSMSGSGWACTSPNCTRTDVLAAGSSYPAITVHVNVTPNASSPQVNAVSVSGGGSANANTTDSTIITEPVLGITKTHTGNFAQGQTNATYTVTVSNSGTAPTSGKVTVTDTIPSGLTLVSMAGANWTCPGAAGANTCDRSDVLAAGSSYEVISVTVNVGASAASPQVNAVAVSGGGSANANTSDSTIITGGATSCPTGGNLALLTGQYAFVLQGFDSNGKVALIGGVLTADGGGNLTAGAVDMNLSAGVQTNLAITAGSNYTMGPDARGCMAITTAAGTQNYRFAMGASGNGHMIDFDSTGPLVTGMLRKQTPAAFSTAQVTGNYAFGIAGPQDAANGGGKAAGAGVLNLSAGSVTGGEMDYNNYNAVLNTDELDGVSGATTWPASPISINNGGTYTVSANGRGTLSFTPNGATAFNAYIYVVSTTEVLILDSDARSVGNLFAGTALQQSGGPFGSASLNGKSVIYNSKLSSNGGTANSSVSIGIVTATGLTSTFSFAGYSNDGGTVSTPTNNTASGTFTVAATGRVTLTVSGGGNETPEFYLISPGNGFSVYSGNGVDSGFMEAQSSASVSGTYSFGSISPQAPGERDTAGAPVFGAGNETGTGDDNVLGVLTPNNPISTTFSVDATGTVFIPASCTPGTNCDKIGAVISPSKFVVMDAKSMTTQGGTATPSLSVADK